MMIQNQQQVNRVMLFRKKSHGYNFFVFKDEQLDNIDRELREVDQALTKSIEAVQAQ